MKTFFALAVLCMVFACAYADHHKDYYFDSWTRYDSASIKKVMVEIDGRLGIRPVLFNGPGGPFNDAVCLERVDKSVGTLFAEGFNGEILPGGFVLCDQGKAFPIGDTPAAISYPLPAQYACASGYHTANVMELATYLDARAPAGENLHFITAEFVESASYFPAVSFTQHPNSKRPNIGMPSRSYAGIGISYDVANSEYHMDSERHRLCVKNDAPLRFVPNADPSLAYELEYPNDRRFHIRPEEVNRICINQFGPNYRGASAGKVASAMRGAFDVDATALLLSQGIYIVTPDKTVGGLFPSMLDVRTQCDAYEGKADPYNLMRPTLESDGEIMWNDNNNCASGTYQLNNFLPRTTGSDTNTYYATFTSCDASLFSEHLLDDRFSSSATASKAFDNFRATGFDSSDFHYYFGDRTASGDCQYYPRLASLDVPPLMSYVQRTDADTDPSTPDACTAGGSTTVDYAGICGYVDEAQFDLANQMYTACVREESSLASQPAFPFDTSAPFGANPSFFGTSPTEPYIPYFEALPFETDAVYSGPNENSNAPNNYFSFGGLWQSPADLDSYTFIPRPYETFFDCAKFQCDAGQPWWSRDAPTGWHNYCNAGRNPTSCVCSTDPLIPLCW